MAGLDLVLEALRFLMRELGLFAATGFLLLGTSDLFVDLIWIGRSLRRRFGRDPAGRARADTIEPPLRPGRLAIFVPAWDEAAVLGRMLANAVATFRHEDYLIYVGCYPNDPPP